MSNQDGWEDVVVPQGTFIGWGEVGQCITGYVVGYDEQGGTDFNKNPCPQLVIELTQECTNYRDLLAKVPTKETIEAGEFVTLECGLASLKKAVRAAVLEVGNLVRITHDGTYKADKGTGKSFKVQVNRAPRPSAPSADSLV